MAPQARRGLYFGVTGALTNKAGAIPLLNNKEMKYPKKQFEVLKECLKQLSAIYDIKGSNVTMHYICYQQISDGQQHNHLYCYGSQLKRYYSLNEEQKTKFVKFIDINFDFKLYPDGCNDSHIETAMKRAIKELEDYDEVECTFN
jgi:N-acetyl-anhydromuramyl-L-alanine amidase AmpD